MLCVEQYLKRVRVALNPQVAWTGLLCLAALLPGCGSLRPGAPGAQEESGVAAGEPSGGKGIGPKVDRTDRQTGRPFIKLPPPHAPRDWTEARRQAAERLVAANPDISYMGKPPDLLLAIPVMTIELNGDGSIRQISVMRYPSQARDTVNTAMEAIRRAAPFGDVSRLPKPLKFNETFLFNDQRKFKPMTLDRR